MVQAAEYALAQRSGAADGVGDFLSPIAPAFPDVPTANFHYDNVNTGAQVLGLVNGRATGSFNPGDPTQRQQMASFLVRLVDLTLIPEGAEGAEAS